MSELDLFFPETPEEIEEQRLYREKLELIRKKKIQRAVKTENLEFDTRDYGRISDGNSSKQSITLFIGTKIGIYDSPDTLGRIEFIVYENIDLENVYVAAKSRGKKVSGHLDKLIHLDKFGIYEKYRDFGLSEKLISHFFELYKEKYPEYPVSVEFTNPIAEYVVQKILKEKNMQHVMDEKLIQRFYGENERRDDVAIINNIKEKDHDVFPLEAETYSTA